MSLCNVRSCVKFMNIKCYQGRSHTSWVEGIVSNMGKGSHMSGLVIGKGLHMSRSAIGKGSHCLG